MHVELQGGGVGVGNSTQPKNKEILEMAFK